MQDQKPECARILPRSGAELRGRHHAFPGRSHSPRSRNEGYAELTTDGDHPRASGGTDDGSQDGRTRAE